MAPQPNEKPAGFVPPATPPAGPPRAERTGRLVDSSARGLRRELESFRRDVPLAEIPNETARFRDDRAGKLRRARTAVRDLRAHRWRLGQALDLTARALKGGGAWGLEDARDELLEAWNPAARAAGRLAEELRLLGLPEPEPRTRAAAVYHEEAIRGAASGATAGVHPPDVAQRGWRASTIALVMALVLLVVGSAITIGGLVAREAALEHRLERANLALELVQSELERLTREAR